MSQGVDTRLCLPKTAWPPTSDAGAKMSQQPTALQLRYLETLTEIAAEKNSTILFQVPIDILQGLTDLLNKRST